MDLTIPSFPLELGYIKLTTDFIINEVKRIPSNKGEYLNDIHLDKGMLVEIMNMSSGSYYKKIDELCVTIRIVKKYNLPFPNNPNRGKVYKTIISNLSGLMYEKYKLRGNEERCQKIEKLIGVDE